MERKRYFYRPQRSCGQGYVFTRVCLRRSPPWDQADTTPPPGPRRPPLDQADHPPLGPRRTPQTRQTTPPQDQGEPPPGPGRHPPPPGRRLRHTVNERPVRILLECILVSLLYLYFFSEIWRFRSWAFYSAVPAPANIKINFQSKSASVFPRCEWSLPVSDVSAMLVATRHFLTSPGAFWKILACRSLGNCEYMGRMASAGGSSSSPNRSENNPSKTVS